MKKIYLLLLLLPFAGSAQKVSLGLRLGPAVFSPMNTTPRLAFNDKILPSFYAALDIGITVGKNWEGSISLADNTVQTKDLTSRDHKVLYGQNINEVVLRFNRFINPGKTRLYFGFNSGFCFYTNPDSRLLGKRYPKKYAITDKGNGLMVGLQTGIKTAISSRLDLSTDATLQYFGMRALKQFYNGRSYLRYNYLMFPITVGLNYKFGVAKENKDNKRKKTQRPVKKRRSFPEEEWK